jgi:hypothetical protein
MQNRKDIEEELSVQKIKNHTSFETSMKNHIIAASP